MQAFANKTLAGTFTPLDERGLLHPRKNSNSIVAVDKSLIPTKNNKRLAV